MPAAAGRPGSVAAGSTPVAGTGTPEAVRRNQSRASMTVRPPADNSADTSAMRCPGRSVSHRTSTGPTGIGASTSAVMRPSLGAGGRPAASNAACTTSAVGGPACMKRLSHGPNVCSVPR